MFARLKHMAIVSNNYALLGRFYEAAFQMRTSPSGRPESAVVVGDGYVGLNINPRRAGRQAGLDHLGFEVEDVETVFARFREKYPSTIALKRPSNRPFAGISTHDPAGNVFDLSQRGMENRTDVYEDGDWQQNCPINHLALRSVMPDTLAEFYTNVFELQPLEKGAGDPNHYLSDGKVTLVIMPWNITDFEGTGIERPAPDHLGFKVESVAAFREDLRRLVARNPYMAPNPVGSGAEGEARLKLFAQCPFGKHQLSDPDGGLIDVSD